MISRNFVHTGARVLIFTLVLSTLATVVVAEDLEAQPGYVNFENTGLFQGMEPEVEVFLETPLLKVACAAATNVVPEVGDLISDINLAQVKVFKAGQEKQSEPDEQLPAVLNTLKQSGWNYVVRVPEENVNILMKTQGPNITGILGIIVDSGQGVFFNIAGDLKPEKTGTILSSIGMAVMRGNLDFDEIMGQIVSGNFTLSPSADVSESDQAATADQPFSK